MATEEQIRAELARRERQKAVQAELARRAAPQKEPEPWYEDAAEGFATGVMKTAYGIKDLLGVLSQDERDRLADYEKDASESGWGTGGRVVSEVAQLAIPGGAVAKGGKALSNAANLGSKARFAGTAALEGGLAAGHGYARLPEAGESRARNMATSGLAGVGGAAAAKAMSPLLGRSLFKQTDEAKTLADEGVYLTPGMAAQSPAIKNIEAVMEVTPFLARGTKAARARAGKEWSENALKKAVPEHLADRITKTGQEGVAQAKKAIQEGYEAAWSKGGDLTARTKRDLMLRLAKEMDELPVEDHYVLNRLAKNIQKYEPGDNLRLLDDAFRRAEKASKNSHYLQDAVTEMRQMLRQSLPKEAQQAVAVMDASYPNYLAVRKAASKAAEEGGEFTPKHLVQASRTVGGETRAATGKAPLLKEAQAGAATVGKKMGGQPLEWFRRVASIAPTPLPLQTAGRVAMAQTGPQKRMAELLRDNELLELYLTGPRLGAAYED